VEWREAPLQQESLNKENSFMNQRRRIRLSTMEIVLISTLIGSLLLSLLPAFQQERLLAASSKDRTVSGEHQ
jgi:hypothetical protein